MQRSLFDPPPSPRAKSFRRAGLSTSRDAAAANAPRAGTQRARILAALAATGDNGATDFELSISTGIARHVAAKRRGELVDDGFATASGRVRTTDTGSPAVVWVATERGRRARAEL